MVEKERKIDHFILLIISAIILLGILNCYSLSIPYSILSNQKQNYFFWHQLWYGYIPGLIALIIVYKINLFHFKKWANIIFIVLIILNLLVFISFFSGKKGGATRWIQIGNLSFQPFEFSKPFFLLFFAKVFSEKKEEDFKEFLKLFSYLFILVIVLAFQSHGSNVFLISSCFLFLYFISYKKLKYLIVAVLILGMIGLLLIKFSPYRLNRIINFLNPEKDPMNTGYQLKQILMTIGSGGIWGKGLGMSEYKFLYLVPKAIFDAPFAIWAQEAGFIGSISLTILFLTFFFKCAMISKRMKDEFSRLLIWAISFWLVEQFLINVGAMIRLFPITGVPLPFFSYGGSAIIGQMIGLGLLLNASKKA